MVLCYDGKHHCNTCCGNVKSLLFVSAVSAHVVGEDEAVMKAASAKDLVLKIWHSKDGPVSDKPPARVRTFETTQQPCFTDPSLTRITAKFG